MSRRNIAEEWKLEDGDETNEQWNLQPAEQSAISQWQLQEEGNEPLPRGGLTCRIECSHQSPGEEAPMYPPMGRFTAHRNLFELSGRYRLISRWAPSE